MQSKERAVNSEIGHLIELKLTSLEPHQATPNLSKMWIILYWIFAKNLMIIDLGQRLEQKEPPEEYDATLRLSSFL